jgi:O-antigen ligase
MAFYSALVVVFLRYSLVHELLARYGGVNNYLLYLFSVPALIGLVGSDGFRRIFSARPAFYWTAFACWMTISVPFSIWMGDSAKAAMAYFRTDLPMLFFLAGLPMTWKECRMVLYTIGFAGLVNVGSGVMYRGEWGQERVGLDFSTLANPNDYAGHLLLVMPLILFMVIRRPGNAVTGNILRIVGVGAIGYGVYLTVATASRGALIGLTCVGLLIFIKTRMTTRFALAAAVPVMAVVVAAALPQNTRVRLLSFSMESDGTTDAAESSRIRRYILERSLIDTITHPIFGVGPGQFGNFEGQLRRDGEIKLAAWINPHNSYTQISSENGFPGILLYLAGIVSPILLLRKMNKTARDNPRMREVYIATNCIMVSYTGFLVAITFLNFAYFFYLPAFAGLIVAFWRCFQTEIVPQSGFRPLSNAVAVPAALTSAGHPASKLTPPVRRANKVRFTRLR